MPTPLLPRQMFFSREEELKVFKVLGELGFGPALLATLEDGRVEEFLEGKVTPLLFSMVALISTMRSRTWWKLTRGWERFDPDRKPCDCTPVCFDVFLVVFLLRY